MWKRYRAMLRDVRKGLPPARAADIHGIPDTAFENPRFTDLVHVAEAQMQRDALAAVHSAASPGVAKEWGWADEPSDGSRAPTRARQWQRAGDWKAAAFLLERRYPAEWGQQQPPTTGDQVVEVLRSLAALRDGGQPVALRVHRPRELSEGTGEAGTP